MTISRLERAYSFSWVAILHETGGRASSTRNKFNGFSKWTSPFATHYSNKSAVNVAGSGGSLVFPHLIDLAVERIEC